MKRVILFVMDSVGIGGLPDSESYGDVKVNTLGHIAESVEELKIPNLEKLGIGHLPGLEMLNKVDAPTGSFGRSLEVSKGKDTTTGHWEIAGLVIDTPFKTYPNGFPKSIIDEFEEKTGRKVVCNAPASGTEVIERLGKHHMETGDVIVYTSADSVFQIAAHEEIVPLDELYKMCEIAREMLLGEEQVARVIARPFVGEPGNFQRTSNRRDYSLKPFDKTVLDYTKNSGKEVKAVGKIVDIFNGEGITADIHTTDNMDGVDQTIKYLKEDFEGIIFTNLVDFDAKFGHRRDPQGYAKALEELDQRIPEILEAMNDDDMIMFFADHGNDPTYKGSDHTREYIPILVYGKEIKAGVDIGTRESFADIAATTAEALGVKSTENGKSFLKEIKK